MVIDSGSTLTYIDKSAYSRLEAMVKRAITAEPIAKPPQELRLCYDKKSKIEGNVNVVLRNVFIEFDEHVCFGIVPTQEEGDPMILGNVAQVNFEVEFDLQARTVSFTPTNCDQDHGGLY
ncbi:Aspartic proteinase CDR1 [Bienertia sinuspersici]